MPSSQPNTILDREGPLTITRMELEHVAPLSTRLSSNDLHELEKLGVDAFEALFSGYRLGSFVGLVDGEVEAAFGVNKNVYPAAIWFLGSKRARQHRRHFITMSRRWVEWMNRDCAVANVVPADNKTTIAWLKSLDFEFEDEVYTINGHAFLRFQRGPLTTNPPH